MNRRASCVGTFEVFEAAHVALRTLLAFSQPVNCIFWPIAMLNWLVAASKLHKHRETCCTAEWPFYSFLILWRNRCATSIRQHPPDTPRLRGKRNDSSDSDCKTKKNHSELLNEQPVRRVNTSSSILSL